MKSFAFFAAFALSFAVAHASEPIERTHESVRVVVEDAPGGIDAAELALQLANALHSEAPLATHSPYRDFVVPAAPNKAVALDVRISNPFHGGAGLVGAPGHWGPTLKIQLAFDGREKITFELGAGKLLAADYPNAAASESERIAEYILEVTRVLKNTHGWWETTKLRKAFVQHVKLSWQRLGMSVKPSPGKLSTRPDEITEGFFLTRDSIENTKRLKLTWTSLRVRLALAIAEFNFSARREVSGMAPFEIRGCESLISSSSPRK